MHPRLEKIFARCKLAGECLEWTGALNDSGGKRNRPAYPMITFDKMRWQGNRLVYMLSKGHLIQKMQVCHTCDNTKCLNPEHLWQGTNQQNVDDKMRKGRHHQKNQTHCKRGHEFTDENTYKTTRGSRSCRVCLRALWRKYDRAARERLRSATN
jgi:hypothetical protein